MHIHIVSIFPDIFTSFLQTSLIKRGVENGILEFTLIDPRDFTKDKHKQVDDEPYGGGAGLVIMAQPVIDAIKSVKATIKDNDRFKIVMMGPSKSIFDQTKAHTYADDCDDIILLCGRYEGFDHRIEVRCNSEFGDCFEKVSIGKFVTLGGESPAMSIIEAVTRLVPGVIGEEMSRKNESYRPEKGGANLEHPHYTRPQDVEGLTVPDVLLSGNHKEIDSRRNGSEHTL